MSASDSENWVAGVVERRSTLCKRAEPKFTTGAAAVASLVTSDQTTVFRDTGAVAASLLTSDQTNLVGEDVTGRLSAALS